MPCQTSRDILPVRLHDKTFRILYHHKQVTAAIAGVAGKLNEDYAGRETPLLVGVLNGAFMFLSELAQCLDFPCEIAFVKVASYAGLASTGEVSQTLGLEERARGRHIILVEDIVDTGRSIEHLLNSISEYEPASVAVATLLLKPDVYRGAHRIDYCALEVPDRFVVGFGLDYNQLGRNLRHIYELAE